jgi:hypothetical protein
LTAAKEFALERTLTFGIEKIPILILSAFQPTHCNILGKYTVEYWEKLLIGILIASLYFINL